MGRPKRRLSPSICARVNRDINTKAITKVVKVVNKLYPPFRTKSKGRPPHDPRVVAACCILKVFFGLSYDGIEAFVKHNAQLKELFGVSTMPGHSVIERGMKRLSTKYLRRAIRLLANKLTPKHLRVAPDSTGFTLNSRSRWFDIRIRRQNLRRDNLKLHIIIDTDSQMILDFAITSWEVHDSTQFKRLLRDLKELCDLVADAAYSSRANHNLVAARGGTAHIAFKSNATGKSGGSSAWWASFKQLEEDPEAWKSAYHRRSLVETVMSVLKRCWKSFLRAKKISTQRTELALKVFCHNLKRALYFEEAANSGVNPWITCQ